MSEKQIARILIRRAELARARPDHYDTFTGDPEADTLIHDLRRTPHMFVLGCIMDRQIKAQRSWRICKVPSGTPLAMMAVAPKHVSATAHSQGR